MGRKVILGLMSVFCLIASLGSAGDRESEETLVRDAAVLAWCTRLAEDPPTRPCCIVGVRDHHISITVDSCQHLGVVTTAAYYPSHRAIHLGRSQHAVPVVILGHAPVLVDGVVALGDFIVPSGRNDGVGRAMAPNQWRQCDPRLPVLGMACQAHAFEGLHLVDTAVGFWDKSIIERICSYGIFPAPYDLDPCLK